MPKKERFARATLLDALEESEELVPSFEAADG
jgi:hypothetical protein